MSFTRNGALQAMSMSLVLRTALTLYIITYTYPPYSGSRNQHRFGQVQPRHGLDTGRSGRQAREGYSAWNRQQSSRSSRLGRLDWGNRNNPDRIDRLPNPGSEGRRASNGAHRRVFNSLQSQRDGLRLKHRTPPTPTVTIASDADAPAEQLSDEYFDHVLLGAEEPDQQVGKKRRELGSAWGTDGGLFQRFNLLYVLSLIGTGIVVLSAVGFVAQAISFCCRSTRSGHSRSGTIRTKSRNKEPKNKNKAVVLEACQETAEAPLLKKVQSKVIKLGSAAGDKPKKDVSNPLAKAQANSNRTEPKDLANLQLQPPPPRRSDLHEPRPQRHRNFQEHQIRFGPEEPLKSPSREFEVAVQDGGESTESDSPRGIKRPDRRFDEEVHRPRRPLLNGSPQAIKKTDRRYDEDDHRGRRPSVPPEHHPLSARPFQPANSRAEYPPARISPQRYQAGGSRQVYSAAHLEERRQPNEH